MEGGGARAVVMESLNLERVCETLMRASPGVVREHLVVGGIRGVGDGVCAHFWEGPAGVDTI